MSDLSDLRWRKWGYGANGGRYDYPTCARTSFSLLLLSSAALAVASAAVLAPAEPRSSISDGILQRQDSTPRTPPPPLLDATPTAPHTTVSLPITVPAPGADISLRIAHVGESWFAASLVEALCSGAHAAIRGSVAWRPDEAVAPLPWFHSLYRQRWRDTIAVCIRGNEGKVFTWLQLEWVLDGLLGLMEGGEPGRLHPVDFDVDGVEQGIVAAGVLWYSQSPPPWRWGGESEVWRSDEIGVDAGVRGIGGYGLLQRGTPAAASSMSERDGWTASVGA